MVRPSSTQPATSAAISASVSGVSTTNGYSTRQSVASVTCDTRDSPSNLMLSLAVTLPSTLRARPRQSQTSEKCFAKSATAWRAPTSSSATKASRVASAAGVRRFSTSARRWFNASMSSARRFGLSRRSSSRYGFRCTTQMSPSTS